MAILLGKSRVFQSVPTLLPTLNIWCELDFEPFDAAASVSIFRCLAVCAHTAQPPPDAISPSSAVTSRRPEPASRNFATRRDDNYCLAFRFKAVGALSF
jgi:hypothetical protein